MYNCEKTNVCEKIDILNEPVLCKRKNFLIIVTGLSGSGKTTLTKKLYKISGLEPMPLDNYKMEIYDTYGFLSDKEKEIMVDLAKAKFKASILLKMRTGNSFIIEHPFNISWQKFFDAACNDYGYTSIVINCNSRTFENIWHQKVKRDLSQLRHPAHRAKIYIKDSFCEYDDSLYKEKHKQEEKRKWEDETYTKITGDFIITDKDVFKLLNFEKENKTNV